MRKAQRLKPAFERSSSLRIIVSCCPVDHLKLAASTASVAFEVSGEGAKSSCVATAKTWPILTPTGRYLETTCHPRRKTGCHPGYDVRRGTNSPVQIAF